MEGGTPLETPPLAEPTTTWKGRLRSRGEVRKLGFQLLKHHYEASKAAGVDVVALKESLLDCVKDADPMVVFVTIEAIPALFDQSDRMAVMALVR